jgi:hypothetical protein
MRSGSPPATPGRTRLLRSRPPEDNTQEEGAHRRGNQRMTDIRLALPVVLAVFALAAVSCSEGDDEGSATTETTTTTETSTTGLTKLLGTIAAARSWGLRPRCRGPTAQPSGRR